MASLTGSQQVHLAVTVFGEKLATLSQSPFPPCSAITAANPFPSSPSPVYTLLAQNITGGPYPYSDTQYPHANCAVDVAYQVGQTKQQSTIYLVETYATVIAGW